MITQPTTELEQLANLYGVQTAYEDVHRRRREATVESLLGALRALGADVEAARDVPAALERRQHELLSRGIEPVVVAWDGRSTDFALTIPARRAHGTVTCTVHCDGGPMTLRFDLESGRGRGNPTPRRKLRGKGPRVGSVAAVEQCREPAALPGFVTVRLRTPAAIEPGYHPMIVETPGGAFESLVISAPTQAYSSSVNGGPIGWGCFLPLYALRTARNWGAGDFTDLATLAEWVRGLGGQVVGTLPLLAAQLDEPCDPSPYAPVSRLFWNEFYIDVAGVPELENCPEAQRLLESNRFLRELESLRNADLVDYRRIMALKRQVLQLLADSLCARDSSRRGRFGQFLEEHPAVEDYARFRAAGERFGTPWQQWPAQQRNGELSLHDGDPAVTRYWCYAQWVAAEQIERLTRRAEGAAQHASAALYLDLPLGVRMDGYDVWRNQSLYTSSATAGAPPDAVWTNGQDWMFSPLDPEAIRRHGYGHVRDYLGHFLKQTRLLRIDHVMSLHRLYWIPAGFPADQGVYVRYRPDELYAVLSLESHRHESCIVGENLGTVPPEVDEAMQRHHVRQMYVVEYELLDSSDEPLREVPHRCVASLTTHDMPQFAAWWKGLDIPDRRDLGLIDDARVRRERRHRNRLKKTLTGWMREHGWLSDDGSCDYRDVLRALLRMLSAGPAELLLVNLEDLWLEERPQNTPGTAAERPNWQVKSRMSFEEFAGSPEIVQWLQEIDRFRRREP